MRSRLRARVPKAGSRTVRREVRDISAAGWDALPSGSLIASTFMGEEGRVGAVDKVVGNEGPVPLRLAEGGVVLLYPGDEVIQGGAGALAHFRRVAPEVTVAQVLVLVVDDIREVAIDTYLQVEVNVSERAIAE